MLKNEEWAKDRVLEAARRKLVETGTRNRLIHMNRANQRANVLNIFNEISDDVFDLLSTQGKRLKFLAMGKDRQASAENSDDDGFEDEDIHIAGEGEGERSDERSLKTLLGSEAQARRLLKLASDAKSAEEEQGFNVLFLALGCLKWRESPNSSVWREAPLVLLPVELLRNARSGTFDIRARDDDMTTNLALRERLRGDFGVILPEIEDTEGWSPTAYFDSVSNAVAPQDGWAVEPDAIQLGFFTFAKSVMIADLAADAWPDDQLRNHPLVSGLLSEGFEGDKPVFAREDRLDAVLEPAEIIQVVDADASQTMVIEEVRRGRNLVVQGPPGTGKSQTITNIIASAVHDGKKVLFVAEKMAALSVVHDRLVRVGLGHVCLELHSRSANKKALARELGETLKASAEALPRVSDVEALKRSRDELNRISESLHAPTDDSGDTPFGAMSELIGFFGRGVKPPSISREKLETVGPAERQIAGDAISRLGAAVERTGLLREHVFYGVREHDLQPTDLARLEQELSVVADRLAELSTVAIRLAQQYRLPRPTSFADVFALVGGLQTLSAAPSNAAEVVSQSLLERAGQERLSEALAVGSAWATAHRAAEGQFTSAAWSAEINATRQAIVAGQGSFFSRLFGSYRKASAELAGYLSGGLPKSPAERLALVDQIASVQSLRRQLADEEAWLSAALGEGWRGEKTNFALISKVAGWLAEVRGRGLVSAHDILDVLGSADSALSGAQDLETLYAPASEMATKLLDLLQYDLERTLAASSLNTADVGKLAATFAAMHQGVSRYDDWATLARALESAVNIGAGEIAEAITRGERTGADAADEFRYACAEARWNSARASRPDLRGLAAFDRHGLVQKFQERERARLRETRYDILSRHYSQIPTGSAGEMAIIRGEIGRKARHKPIRVLMDQAGSMIQRIKPVMLMSPISVAQFLPAGKIEFDLLVIDEASQVRPEEALGAIARARQIVVVGDQKQLPPTSFFDRLVNGEDLDDEEDDDMPAAATVSDMESILSLAEARGIRSRMLEWHYRSRVPSLIQVSNGVFYDDNLVLPPSPLQLDPSYGLRFQNVPGAYARGKSGGARSGTNKIEAQYVVKAVAEHARTNPELSLGVVAFSKRQADTLTEIMEYERRRDPVLDKFLAEGQAENVFVKNIENVQGDERDVILISVGYGPSEPNGRMISMWFGPVNKEGGERRLNVLFTRARVRCTVFASFDPGEMNLSSTKNAGPRVLKRFLDFAKTGIIEEKVATGLGADSPFEEDVIRAIRDLGYEADPQVGTAGFRIDIGVRHADRPGQYLMAVECDGAAYHSALWARERDRLRQDVLENLGWKFHRIWSTDWFHRREGEIRRLAEALSAARMAFEKGIVVRGANAGGRVVAEAAPATDTGPVDIDHIKVSAPPYKRAEIAMSSALGPLDVPQGVIGDLVSKIIEIEGPIHIDELVRRVAGSFGKQRAGNRIQGVTVAALAALKKRDGSQVAQLGDFVLTHNQYQNPPVRNREAETGNVLKAEYLPPMEIKAAASYLYKECGAMGTEDMSKAVANLLGFRRRGPDLSEAINRAVQEFERDMR